MVVKQYPEFITVTANDWLPVLSRDSDKRIILDSLQFLVSAQLIKVTAFVLMDTHFHLIWQVLGEHKREDPFHFPAESPVSGTPR